MKWLAALAVMWLVTLPNAAHAGVQDVGSSTDGGTVTVGETVTAPGSGTAGDDSARPVVHFDVTWVTAPDTAPAGDLEGLCAAPGSTPDAPVFGYRYHLIGTDAAGKIVDDEYICVAFTNGDPAIRPPIPALPAVPTFGEAWNSAPIPPPVVTLDPATRGITGLDTLISTAGPATVTIAATIRGYTITGTANLDHYAISVDGQPVIDAGAGHYTFETKGDHTVAVSAVWHGTAVITGPALAVGRPAIDLGLATVTSTRTYTVHEIRSVLQP